MIKTEILERLQKLHPTFVEVFDESESHRGHAGWQEGGQSHFRIKMSSAEFVDKTRLQRHRMVHDALGDIVPRIHALALELSPDHK